MIQDSYPDSLNAYLRQCRTLQLPRRCSDVPLFSHSIPSPSSPSSQAGASHTQRFGSLTPHLSQSQRVGMTSKKSHEVERFLALLSTSPSPLPRRAIDIGSGRAHLSRTLTEPPWGMDVLAVDWSESQKEGGERLDRVSRKDTRKGKAKAEVDEADLGEGGEGRRGKLEHRVQKLDEPSILALLDEDAASSTTRQGPLVVALHACGDLTPSLLRAFVTHIKGLPTDEPGTHKPTLVAVGCCYNLLSDPSLPLSSFLPPSRLSLSPPSSTPSNPSDLSSSHRQLAANCPRSWLSSDQEWDRNRRARRKLLFRARWQVEKDHATRAGKVVRGEEGEEGGDETRLRRVPDRFYERYDLFRDEAFRRIGISPAPPCIPLAPLKAPVESRGAGEDEREEAVLESRYGFRLSVGWTLRALLGPLIESLIVLDRYVGVCQAISDSGSGWTVELCNLFDQSTGSLRNLAIVVRPSPSTNTNARDESCNTSGML